MPCCGLSWPAGLSSVTSQPVGVRLTQPFDVAVDFDRHQAAGQVGEQPRHDRDGLPVDAQAVRHGQIDRAGPAPRSMAAQKHLPSGVVASGAAARAGRDRRDSGTAATAATSLPSEPAIAVGLGRARRRPAVSAPPRPGRSGARRPPAACRRRSTYCASRLPFGRGQLDLAGDDHDRDRCRSSVHLFTSG